MVGARGGGGGVAGEMGRVEENAKTSGMIRSLTTIRAVSSVAATKPLRAKKPQGGR